MDRKAKQAKVIAFGCLAFVVVAASCFLGGEAGLAAFGPWAALEDMVSRDIGCALAVYFACTVVGCTVLFLPGAAFALAAGALFGPVLGTVACVLAATAGAVLSFLVGRFFLRDAVRPRAMRNVHLRKWLFGGANLNAVVLLAVTRLVPLFPYNLQNFAYGVTDMKVATYAVFSFVFMIPGTVMYVLAGAGVAQGASGIGCFVASALMAVAVFAVAGFLKRRYGVGDECGRDEDVAHVEGK